jgi:hypothetical protein
MMKSGLALAALSIAISHGYAAAPHPRILLDPDTLVTLRQSASRNAQWSTLKAKCDGYLPGVVYPGKTELGRYDYFARGSDYQHATSPPAGPPRPSARGWWRSARCTRRRVA